jgi:hypothetical protein
MGVSVKRPGAAGGLLGVGLVVAGWRSKARRRLTRSVVVVLVDHAGEWSNRWAPLRNANEQRVWQPRVEKFRSEPVLPGDVVMLGDSITHWGDWPALLPGVPIHNHGISGDTTDGLLRRLDLVTAGKPGKVFVLIGTNDLAMRVHTASEVVANELTIVDRIRAESPTTEIWVQSVLPRRRRWADQIRKVNADLEPEITGRRMHWVDLWPAFDRGDGEVREELTRDQLHPNDEGYQVWTGAIRPLVLS